MSCKNQICRTMWNRYTAHPRPSKIPKNGAHFSIEVSHCREICSTWDCHFAHFTKLLCIHAIHLTISVYVFRYLHTGTGEQAWTGKQAGRRARMHARRHPFKLSGSALPRIECFPKRIANGNNWQTSCCYSIKFIPIFLCQFWTIVFRLSMDFVEWYLNTRKHHLRLNRHHESNANDLAMDIVDDME